LLIIIIIAVIGVITFLVLLLLFWQAKDYVLFPTVDIKVDGL